MSATQPVSTNHPKRLVLCLDGTWNSVFREQERSNGDKVLKPTNVLKTGRAVLPRDPKTGRVQLIYYDTGLGALSLHPGISNKLLRCADRILGGAWGAGFEANIEEALTFIVNNHEIGDEIFLFGFSRGAATARALTRFIDWLGGLPVKNDAFFLPILFRAYIVSKGEKAVEVVIGEINNKLAEEKRPPLNPLKKIDIVFLGVWDTVMSVGSRFKARGASQSRSFHVDEIPALCVRHARQALAIDEARFDFRPEIWQKCSDSQTLKQRWFAGVHSNVGGGYVDDGLANIPLHWIINEAEVLGLAIDKDFIKHFKPFPQDRLFRSGSLWYTIAEIFRFRLGQGRRRLDAPLRAPLTLDRTVIQRMQADPLALSESGKRRFPELRGKPYRPRNVLRYLACLPNLKQFLEQLDLKNVQLPDDVNKEIQRLKAVGC